MRGTINVQITDMYGMLRRLQCIFELLGIKKTSLIMLNRLKSTPHFEKTEHLNENKPYL